MNWKNTLIIALAVVLAGIIGYIFYLSAGPYKRLSQENKELKAEIEARQALEFKTEKEIYQLSGTLEEQRREIRVARDELAKKDHLVEDLGLKIGALREMILKAQGEKETFVAEASQLRKDLEKSQSRLSELSQEIGRLRDEYQRKVQGLQGELVQRDRSIQRLQKEAGQFRQTIATLEGNKQALDHQIAELKNELQQSQNSVRELSSDVSDREERLKEMSLNYQVLAEQLKEQIQQKEVQISFLEEKLKIHFLGRILFNPGNASITPHGLEVLKNVAEGLKKLEGTEVCVNGHTDNLPLSEDARTFYIDNLGLSVARAAAVARTLRTMGVDPNHLSAAGYSMYRPIASNAKPEGREKNRRVEIILVPLH